MPFDDNHLEFKGCGKPTVLNFKAYRIKDTDTEDLSHFSLNPGKPTAKFVVVKYNGLAGNLPKTYDNSIALWLGSIPNRDIGPLTIVKINKDQQAGDVNIPCKFQQLAYSLTYQVGALKTMCALAQLDLTNVSLKSETSDVSFEDDKKNISDMMTLEPAESFELDTNVPTYVDMQIL